MKEEEFLQAVRDHLQAEQAGGKHSCSNPEVISLELETELRQLYQLQAIKPHTSLVKAGVKYACLRKQSLAPSKKLVATDSAYVSDLKDRC